MTCDRVQLTVNINFYSKFFNGFQLKKLFDGLIYWEINFAVSVDVNLLVPGIHHEAIKT